MLANIILKKLMHKTKISKTDITWICQSVKRILLDQPTLLKLKPPIIICGDTHGQFRDTCRIFDICGSPSSNSYLFLGDYVDRGLNGVENLCYLLLFKILYPNTFYLLRGNHESSVITKQFGFYDECIEKYDKDVWKCFCGVFNCLPIAAVIGNKIFCVHGGISPQLRDIENDLNSIKRPIEIHSSDLLSDLLWSDPNNEVDEWEENDRGTGVFFGLNHFLDFINKNGFEYVFRAHQAVKNGYDFPFTEDIGLITIFSAPNYCNFGNDGGVMYVDEDFNCSFTIIDPELTDPNIQFNDYFNEALDEYKKKSQYEEDEIKMRKDRNSKKKRMQNDPNYIKLMNFSNAIKASLNSK
ncbi:serine/threonine protein phosphatase Pzh1 [Tritrichomonas musculus]|uniref:Serine/threonine-protein phosphatase n=1 Tax=Tritrichomonas musculus TaxID=1915356 RepID=A0ABR2KIF7_9EUKA